MKQGTQYNHWEVINKESYDKVLCKCVCGTEKHVRANYLKNGSSRSCGCMNDFYKKQTNLKNFGVEWVVQNTEIAKKISKTKLSKTSEQKRIAGEKRNETNLKRYGTKAPNRKQGAAKQRRQVLKGTKFGYWEVHEDRNQSELIKVKCTACNITIKDEKLCNLRQAKSCGCITKEMRVENCLKAKRIKQYKKGFLFTYWQLMEDYKPTSTRAVLVKCTGCNKIEKSVSLSDLIDEKTKSCGCMKMAMTREISMEKYGVPFILQSDEIRQKGCETMQRNGNGVRTSKQQLHIFEMLKTAGYAATLNQTIGRFNTDVGLEIGDIKIALEYDGGGHFVWNTEEKVQAKDAARNTYMIKEGWKICRIESRKDKLPELKELTDQINILLNTYRNITFIKIS